MNFIEGSHPLLESTSPPYTNATVRRAFIVWMHCGQRNSFKDVCNYYHYLENLEDKLPADRRASSRRHEFNMFSSPPPTSSYLDEIFPNLYTQNHSIIQHYIKKVDTITESAVKLDTFPTQNGISTNEILVTSNLIKSYCRTHMIPIEKFLIEFKDYARKCSLNYTVHSVTFYIKRKMVAEELMMVENYSKRVNVLNKIEPNAVKVKTSTVCNKMSVDQLKFLSSINLEIPAPIQARSDVTVVSQFWNNLACNYGKMTVTNTLTRS